MTFYVNSVQRLIVAAGGDVKPGTPLKTYLWKLSQEISQPGEEIRTRSLERAWREGQISGRVRDALEKAAIKRALNDELQLVRDFEAMLDRIEKESDQADIPRYVTVARTCLTWVRWTLARRYEVSVVAGCIRLADAAEREAALDAAE